MSAHPLRRARVLGAMIALASFGLGVAAGITYANRPRPGMAMTVITSDAIPQELEQLGLTDTERTQIRQILRAAQPRMIALLNEFEPKMRATLAETDDAIAAVLNPQQRAAWEAFRRSHPPRIEKRRPGGQ